MDIIQPYRLENLIPRTRIAVLQNTIFLKHETDELTDAIPQQNEKNVFEKNARK